MKKQRKPKFQLGEYVEYIGPQVLYLTPGKIYRVTRVDGEYYWGKRTEEVFVKADDGHERAKYAYRFVKACLFAEERNGDSLHQAQAI